MRSRVVWAVPIWVLPFYVLIIACVWFAVAVAWLAFVAVWHIVAGAVYLVSRDRKMLDIFQRIHVRANEVMRGAN